MALLAVAAAAVFGLAIVNNGMQQIPEIYLAAGACAQARPPEIGNRQRNPC